MTSMSSPYITSCLLLLLLACVQSTSEVERPRQSQVGGQSGREGILPAAAPDLTTLRTVVNVTEDNNDDISRIVIPELVEKDEHDKVDAGEVDDNEEEEEEGKEETKEAKEKNEEKEEEDDENEGEEDEEEGEEGEEEEEYEGDDDDEDEYEDELKAIAESHEAMSKDEARKSNASSAGGERAEEKLSSVKNFDSHEKSNEDMSDEDVASNEAIGGDIIEEEAQDEEVAELLKYKMEKSVKAKVKRMPTVKKELSTQREILLASNETQVPKSLLPSEDPFNRLSGKTDYVERRSLEGNEIQEVALADSLLKFLVKLAEDPNRWQRVHKLLANMENDLQASKNIQDPVKRGYDTTSTLSSTTPSSTDAPKKSRKKPKKKKKRPRHRQTSTTVSTTTASSSSVTSTPMTTTETWSTTTPQWRLVAERLFGPPWQQDTHEESKNVAKVRYGVASKPRTSVWELVDQDKPKNVMRTMNTERIPLLDFPRESNSQSRALRFGKVNTYQPLRLQDSREFTPLYDRPADSDRSADYYLSEAVYPPLRYMPSREFLRRRNENDYQDDLTLQTDNFPYNQEYRPPSREFASNKGWSELAYKHSRPWSSEERPLFTMSPGKWPWGQQNDIKYWPERGKYPDRNYWTTLGNEEDGDRINQAEIEEWQRFPAWEAGKSNIWPMGETLKTPLWPQTDRPLKPYDQSITWEKSKNHSELNKKEDTGDKVVLPKITMKTWNSLTSDPATWPYKLPSAKPWPKDENGKSYNPNADLVRKLGLDKENNADWSKSKDDRTGRIVFEKQTDSVATKDTLKKKEFVRLNDPKYKTISNRSNYSDYKRPQSQESMKETPNWMYQDVKQPKEWIKPQIASSLSKNGEAHVWERKFDISAGSQVKGDEHSFSHYWPLNTVASTDQKWSDKERDELTDPWKDSTKDSSPLSTKVNNGNFWKEKSNDSWLPKTKADLWTTRMKSAPVSWGSKVGDNNSWTSKADNSAAWMLKSNDAASWTTNSDIWGKSNNADSWSASSNDLPAWSVKEKSGLVADNAWTKSNNAVDWPQKTKDNNSWANKFGGMASWKNNDDNWPRKTEQSSWQQKINDDWNINYNKNSPSTWPSKWKQFVYHKVTAVPISKPGTTADVSPPKSKNAFVAVSAVSSANYNGNDWRKNDMEETMREDNYRLEEADRPSGQIRPEAERPIYAWKKDGSELNNVVRGKSNGTEPLENQLEALRRDDFWPYKQNKVESSEESTYTTTSTTQAAIVTNFTTILQLPREQNTSKAVEKRGQTYQRESLMK